MWSGTKMQIKIEYKSSPLLLPSKSSKSKRESSRRPSSCTTPWRLPSETSTSSVSILWKLRGRYWVLGRMIMMIYLSGIFFFPSLFTLIPAKFLSFIKAASSYLLCRSIVSPLRRLPYLVLFSFPWLNKLLTVLQNNNPIVCGQEHFVQSGNKKTKQLLQHLITWHKC